jgi:primase-polymerase (primpol)-like protein
MGTDVPTADILPDEVTEREQWVCWRVQQRGGKETKVPINPHTGSFGSATNPDSWASFETAREYATEGAAEGLGFVFTGDDPLVGVDLDTCRVPETGTLTDEATDIVERLASYTEVSPSGTGVHVLALGGLPGDRNRKDWVEMYDDARFFTVTGDHLDGTPVTVESRTPAIGSVHAEFVAGKQEPTDEDDSGSTRETTEEPTGAADESETSDQEKDEEDDGLSDEEVVDRAHAAANGEKFERLWRGQTTGYDSHSEADMGLCALLAFWTGGDETQIDRLFRESGLMREKWDERHFADGSTYGEKTIERVLAGTTEFYEPTGTEAATGESETTASERSDRDEVTAETVTLRQQRDELTARQERHLALIADLQEQVERLEARNQRLTAELEAAYSEAESGREDPAAESSSLLTRLRQIFSRSEE